MMSQPSQSPASHSNEWPTQEQAAELLGTTVRTIQRMVSDHKLASQLQPVSGRKPVVLIDPQDIERILGERRKPVLIRDPDDSSTPLRDNAVAVRSQQTDTELVRAFKIALFERPEPTPAPKPWLTLDEAAAYSGLPKSWLLSQARDPDSGEGIYRARCVDAINVGTEKQVRWRFSRAALDGSAQK